MLVCKPQHKTLTIQRLLACFSNVNLALIMPSYPSTLTEEVPLLPAPPQLRVSKALTGRTSYAAEHQEAGRLFHPPQGCRGTVPPPCLPHSMGARSSPAPPAIPWSPAGQLQARQRVRKTTDTGNAGKKEMLVKPTVSMHWEAQCHAVPGLQQPWHHRVSTGLSLHTQNNPAGA